VEGGVGERVMVISMAMREMGCGGGFLKEEGLGVKLTSAGHLVQHSMCVSNETKCRECWSFSNIGNPLLAGEI
jgi:hypothetical protein